MAEPADSYPESATLEGHDERVDGETPDSLRAALAKHDAELASGVERTDELADILTTAIIVTASADDEELDYVTDSTSNLLTAADGLTTDGAATLAGELGENADELAAALETVLELQRTGQLDDLLELAETASALEVDDDAVAGLNTLLSSISEAQQQSRPVSVLGLVSGLRGRDARSGLGYLLSVLQALGRRLRHW